MKHPLLYSSGVKIKHLYEKLFPVQGKNNIVSIKGSVIGLKKSIIGNNNVVEVKDSTLRNTKIWIRGNGNHLVIEEGCNIGKDCSFCLEGSNNRIIIGKKTTMTLRCHFNAQETGTTISVGEDCMFSNTIIVRTSDSHPIYSTIDNRRINPAKDVIIGDHVWIAPSTVIMKGAELGSGCVVGSHSMVNMHIPLNCLVVGKPGRVVKENIHWTRENIVGS